MFKNYALLFTISLFYIKMGFAQNITPKGIIYHYKSDVINKKARQIIGKELIDTTYSLFNKLVTLGPLFWNKYKDDITLENTNSGNITLSVPQYDDSGKLINKRMMSAKLIQSKEDFITVWKAIIINFKTDKFIIRKLKPEELSYYWSVIFYDIEEPIFIVENSNQKILLHLSDENKLIWIDLINN